MSQHLPAIIVIVPLILAIVNSLAGQRYGNAAFYLSIIAMSICLISSLGIFHMINTEEAITYRFGGWPPPIGIEYHVDRLNGFMLVLISFIGLITGIHAKKSVERELPDKVSLFWCLFLLLITGLLGIVMTADLFNLFVFLEVASLAGYALVAAGRPEATVAGFRYLIIGTIGACFYLLGVGYLYIATGTLNMGDLSAILPSLYGSQTITIAFMFLGVGIAIKTALFPLHIWLPDAYTHAPSAVSAVIAPLMTKVMAYVLIRIMFFVFDPIFLITMLNVTGIMIWMGTFAVLFGAVMALSQTDFKRMLSYIIIAEIGYIIGGIGVANMTALKGAVFHIINDAVMMSCLFLTAGQIMYQKGGHRIKDFQGIFKTMPVTAAVFTIAALAIIGVPPTCGFFSKWYLLLGSIQANQWGFVMALAFCTLINIALFFRIFDTIFFTHANKGKARELSVRSSGEKQVPLTMQIPAIVTALAIVLIGVFNQFIINEVLNLRILL